MVLFQELKLEGIGEIAEHCISLQVMVLESNLKTNALLWHSAISYEGDYL